MHRREDAEEKGPPWMSSYADMITILLALFIMLFGMSTAEIRKLRSAAGSLRSALGGKPGPYLDISDLHPGIQTNIPTKPIRKQKITKADLFHEIEIKIRTSNLQNKIQVSLTEQGIVFYLDGKVLFESDQTTLKPEALIALQFIAEELIQFPDNPILIDGHTDPTRYSNDPNGNWKMAAQRAYEVMKYLIDWGRISEERFSYESYAEFQPLPGIDNRIAIGRTMNRRVEIILLQTDDLNHTFFRDESMKDPRTPLITPGSNK